MLPAKVLPETDARLEDPREASLPQHAAQGQARAIHEKTLWNYASASTSAVAAANHGYHSISSGTSTAAHIVLSLSFTDAG